MMDADLAVLDEIIAKLRQDTQVWLGFKSPDRADALQRLRDEIVDLRREVEGFADELRIQEEMRDL